MILMAFGILFAALTFFLVLCELSDATILKIVKYL